MNYFPKILKVAWPACFGYIPLGIACGVLAQTAGMTLLQTIAFSLLLYAGSGQFIGIAMMMQSATIVSIGLTIFIVNLRHLLFSSILLKFLQKKSFWFRALFADGITDESFAVNLTAFEQGSWTVKNALGVNIFLQMTWIASNAVGFVGGEILSVDMHLIGYALTAMFMGLWTFYFTSSRMILAGFTAGILSVVFSLFVGYKMHIVLSAVLTSAIFAFVEMNYAKGGDR